MIAIMLRNPGCLHFLGIILHLGQLLLCRYIYVLVAYHLNLFYRSYTPTSQPLNSVLLAWMNCRCHWSLTSLTA